MHIYVQVHEPRYGAGPTWAPCRHTHGTRLYIPLNLPPASPLASCHRPPLMRAKQASKRGSRTAPPPRRLSSIGSSPDGAAMDRKGTSSSAAASMAALAAAAAAGQGQPTSGQANGALSSPHAEEDENPATAAAVSGGGASGSSDPVAARRGAAGGGPSCQVERCAADLHDARRYYRRHKVCEPHSKELAVLVAGLRQRFCQQCSR